MNIASENYHKKEKRDAALTRIKEGMNDVFDSRQTVHVLFKCKCKTYISLNSFSRDNITIPCRLIRGEISVNSSYNAEWSIRKKVLKLGISSADNSLHRAYGMS